MHENHNRDYTDRIVSMQNTLAEAFDRESKITPRLISYFLGENMQYANYDMIIDANTPVNKSGARTLTSNPQYSMSEEKLTSNEIDAAIAEFHNNPREKSTVQNIPHDGQESQR